MLTYIISSAKFALIFILLNHTAVTIVRASPAGGSVAGLADDIAAELVGQDIQCHENYGTRMDTIASDCVTALTFLSNYAEQYDTTRFEFGDEGIPRSQPMLPSWSTPVTQPFWQGQQRNSFI